MFSSHSQLTTGMLKSSASGLVRYIRACLEMRIHFHFIFIFICRKLCPNCVTHQIRQEQWLCSLHNPPSIVIFSMYDTVAYCQLYHIIILFNFSFAKIMHNCFRACSAITNKIFCTGTNKVMQGVWPRKWWES